MSKLNKAQKNMIKSTKTCGVHVLGEKAIERKVSGSDKLQAARLSAAFYTSKLWPNSTTFNVRFTNLRPDKQDDFTIYDERVLKDSPTEVDPLQKLFWGYDENGKQNINTYKKNKQQIPKWIQKIISERLEPLVNLNFKWHLEEEVNDNFEWKRDDNNIIINFDPMDGSWSLVGTDCINRGKQIRQLASKYQKGELSKKQLINELEDDAYVELADFIANSEDGYDTKDNIVSNLNSESNKIDADHTMNLGWFDVATTIHEFCHALGLIHEHQNPRGEPIDWNEQAVLKYYTATQGWDEATVRTNILNRYSTNITNGSDFDPLSIMLYFFPSSMTNNGVGVKQNIRLSGVDMDYLTKQYPNKPNGSTPAELFRDIYPDSQNGDIEANISLSKEKAVEMSTSSIPWTFIIICILVVLLLGFGIMLIVKK